MTPNEAAKACMEVVQNYYGMTDAYIAGIERELTEIIGRVTPEPIVTGGMPYLPAEVAGAMEMANARVAQIQQARCPECGHNPNNRAHMFGCTLWAKEARAMRNAHPALAEFNRQMAENHKRGTNLLDAAFHEEHERQRYPQQPEELKPQSWRERIAGWFR